MKELLVDSEALCNEIKGNKLKKTEDKRRDLCSVSVGSPNWSWDIPVHWAAGRHSNACSKDSVCGDVCCLGFL